MDFEGGNGFCRRKWAGIGEQKEEEEIRLSESHNCLSRFLGLLILFLGHMGWGRGTLKKLIQGRRKLCNSC